MITATLLFDEFNLDEHPELSIENFANIKNGGTFHCTMYSRQVFDLAIQCGARQIDHSFAAMAIHFEQGE